MWKQPFSSFPRRITLLLITKGDLFDQETKITRSGLSEFFKHIEIVSEKDEATYLSILKRHQIEPERFLMVGNSMRSDILPVLKIGGHAVYVPYEITWSHEIVQPEMDTSHFNEIEQLDQLTGWLESRAPSMLQRLETG